MSSSNGHGLIRGAYLGQVNGAAMMAIPGLPEISHRTIHPLRSKQEARDIARRAHEEGRINDLTLHSLRQDIHGLHLPEQLSLQEFAASEVQRLVPVPQPTLAVA